MPLSEREQRLLDEMERALYAEDPTFGERALDEPRAKGLPRRRLLLGLAGVLAGLGLVVAAIMLKWVWLGALAFVAMLGAVWAAGGAHASMRSAGGAVALRGRAPRGGLTVIDGGAGASRGAGPGAGKESDFMRRLEQRWDERRDREGLG